MKVKDIIKNVCVFLGKEELLDSNLFNEQGNAPTAKEQSDLNMMIKCLNLITDEIASDYIPLLRQKTIIFDDAKVRVDEIDENIKEIISIKTIHGNTLRYRLIGDDVICIASRADIVYTVYPQEVEELGDDAESFSNRLSARVLAYGVASEYCNLQMMYDDATIWETRFKNALLFASRKKGELKLKQRGWL